MDCEHFELIVIDLVYGEASEAEATDARRHTERCDRCSAMLASLRAARKGALLVLEEPPVGIDELALEAARRAQGEVPWPRRLGRAISWVGSYAMRPQLAMAALLLLMIGSSLLLVRGRPGTGRIGVVRVTEQGVPEREHGEVTPREQHLPMTGAASPPRAARAETAASTEASARERSAAVDEAAAAPPGVVSSAASPSAPDASRSSEFDDAMAMYEAKEFAKAQRAFDAIVAAGGPEASQAALYASKAARAASGCGAALPKFDGVITRYGNTAAAVQARWEAAACNRLVGNYDRARQLLADLRNIEGQRDRADHELARLGPARSVRAAPKAAAPAKPSPAKASSAAY